MMASAAVVVAKILWLLLTTTTTTFARPQLDRGDCPLFCPLDVAKVCGTDGQTYDNECKMKAYGCQNKDEDISVVHQGPCDDDMDGANCQFDCTKELKPQCGTDGKTYSNICKLREASCKKKIQIEASHRGHCKPNNTQGGPQKKCPQFCPLVWNPVCGSDGQTYGNQCALESKACIDDNPNLTIKSQGPCQKKETATIFIDRRNCPSICTANYDPVCGTDGVTYSNRCQMEVSACQHGVDIDVASEGQCTLTLAPCKEHCPLVHQPVCGSDGISYANKCELEYEACRSKQDVTVAHEGLCIEVKSVKVVALREAEGTQKKCPQFCALVWNPVCGSDGQTYGNQCALESKACLDDNPNLTINSQGPCQKKETASLSRDRRDCPSICTANYDPVCGTDGVTYSNRCHMEVSACQQGMDIDVASKGQCTSTSPPCSEYCPLLHHPVCGSDGISYANKCELEAAACRSNQDVTVAHEGLCEEVKPVVVAVLEDREVDECNTHCTLLFDPVCGSDGVIYSNLCKMEAEACRSKVEITAAPDSVCEEMKPPEVEAIEAEYENESEEDEHEKKCDTHCALLFDPVCGSDGVIYSNLCALEVADCKSKEEVTVAPDDVCEEMKPPEVSAIEAEDEEVECPTHCSLLFDPVCGSNGVIYPNTCEMEAEACRTQQDIAEAPKEVCESEKPPEVEAIEAEEYEYEDVENENAVQCNTHCTLLYDPACGSDGVLYNNVCELQAEACRSNKEITIEPDSFCEEMKPPAVEAIEAEEYEDAENEDDAQCNTHCTLLFDPVCGSDGVIYTNLCELESEACISKVEITVAADSVCEEMKPPEVSAIEAEDEYENEDVKECDDHCALLFDPVCGSDGVIYTNPCKLEVADCNSNRNITAVPNDQCEENKDPEEYAKEPKDNDDECPTHCSLVIDTVCGSNGVSYNNICELRVEACQSQQVIEVAHDGACMDCPTFCTLEFAPVCGSNGITYGNVCQLTSTACLKGINIEVVSQGPCPAEAGCPDQCPFVFRPVCGSNGIKYTNQCLLEKASCMGEETITVAEDEVCRQ